MTPEQAYARIEVLHGDKLQMLKNTDDPDTEIPDTVLGKERGLRDTLDILGQAIDMDDVSDAADVVEELDQASQLQQASRQARSGDDLL